MNAPLAATDHAADDAPKAPAPGSDLCAFSSPRRSLWGTGSALVIDVPAPWPDHIHEVSTALAAIEGPGEPVAFAALPFDRDSPARFTVPRVLHTRTADGERWRTDVSPATEADPQSALHSDPHDAGFDPAPSATEVTVRSVIPPEQWCTAVATARDAIRAGALTKVVIAREFEVCADVAFDAATMWTRLAEVSPEAFCFAVGGFVGASPELLVSRVGATVRARPMAGTTRRTGHPDIDQRRAGELLGSQKNRIEHQITIDAVLDALLGWCSYVDAEPSPSVVAAGPVQHLATMVEGHLSAPEASVLELVAALHPTPAVGGSPTGVALAMQRDLEDGDRGNYAGPVGWVDGHGNGAFAVGIRSVQLDGPRARLFAGVGVVADSDPEAELDETRSKAQALLSTLVRI